MKTEIITENEPIKSIDWGKPSMVKNNNSELYLITNGDHSGETFSGTIITQGQEMYNTPLIFKTGWLKSAFTPITEPITIKFIP